MSCICEEHKKRTSGDSNQHEDDKRRRYAAGSRISARFLALGHGKRDPFGLTSPQRR